MKTAEDFLRPRAALAGPGALIPYDVALAAVQAAIDHYNPPQPTVFPPACPRCLQRGAECLCPPMFPREEPPF